MAEEFVHLHNHTEYSMLDGAARIEEMIAAAKADGQRAIAITDHGNLYGAIDFYTAAKKAEINPILGFEAYMVDDRFSRPPRRGKIDDTGGEIEGGKKAYNHLTLLCESDKGYRNLRELSSMAFLEGYYMQPRLDWELLERFSDGLIATSGCLGGTVLQSLLRGEYETARADAARLQSIFGRENFFIEMQDHDMPEQRRTNPDLLKIAKEINAPLLATNDLHYVKHSDFEMHDALLCIGTGARVSDADRFRFSSDQHYLKSAAEMRYLFRDIPDACDNTLLIAERANVTIEFDQDALPEYVLPPELASLPHKEGAAKYLSELCYRGAHERFGETLTAEQNERLEYELRVINEMGFADYFLVVWDIIKYARDRGIRVGPGRGSAAGCFIAYCLRIVDLDPIQYGLLFERFLNPGRKSMPDIDMDFDERYRGEMIRYAGERYGIDHVAQIVTFSTIKARAAVRDAARVLGYGPKIGDSIAKAMPPLVLGQDLPLKACFEVTEGYEKRFSEAAELRQMYDRDAEVKHVIDTAMGFVDKRRQAGIHAAAVVITKEPVMEYVPISRKGSTSAGDDAPVVTQYEMNWIEKLGLLKMDFLGLRNLAIIERALDHIERRHNIKVDIDNVALDDPKVFSLLQQGNSMGIFQLEGDKMRQLMRRLAPTQFEDIGALVALYRPGPLSENVHNDYADRKNHRKEVTYEHPDLEEILGETNGLMIYQEDVMRVAQKVAGFTMSEADDLRKACSKKDRDLIQAQRIKFVDGTERLGYGREFGEHLFDKIEPFADYAFNKSHAYGYALIAYQNAWLKANYPVEYMAALLTSFADDKDKASAYLNEARQMGIRVSVPSVNDSLAEYSPSMVEENAIFFGMAAIRNVGEQVVEMIVSERESSGKFASIYDFVRRVDPRALNRRTMESLIKAGAFDCLDVSRQGLLLKQEELVNVTLLRRKDHSLGITTLFASFDDDAGQDWSGTDVPISATEFNKAQKLDFEREMLGTYISDHPLRGSGAELAKSVDATLAQIREQTAQFGSSHRVITLGGIITGVTVKTRKDGRQFANLQVEDLTGHAEVLVSAKSFSEYQAVLIKDTAVIFKARISELEEDLRISGLEFRQIQLSDEVGVLRLQLRSEDMTQENVTILKSILHLYPGPSSVELVTGPSGKTFQLGPECNVSIEAAVGDIRSQFGRDVIIN